VINKRNTRNEKNAQTQRERDTAADMEEARADGDDDDEGGNSEDEDGEYEDVAGSAGDRTASHSKHRQSRSAQCINIIPMPNGGTQGVAQHFLKYHTDLNVRIRTLKVLPGADKNPPHFMTLLNHAAPLTQEQLTQESLTHLSLSLTPTSI
jgi:hypothetical protein